MNGLSFDAGAHLYRYDGVLTPSVTQMLKALGLIDDRFYTPEAADRGTQVHALVAATLDRRHIPAVPLELVGYLLALDLFKRVHRPHPLLIETPLGTRTRCGTVDFFGTIDDSPLTVVLDWKTGPFVWWHEAQTFAYKCLLVETKHVRVHRRGSVHLTEHGTFELKWHTGGENDWIAVEHLIARRLEHHGEDERARICGADDPTRPDPRAAAREAGVGAAGGGGDGADPWDFAD